MPGGRPDPCHQIQADQLIGGVVIEHVPAEHLKVRTACNSIGEYNRSAVATQGKGWAAELMGNGCDGALGSGLKVQPVNIRENRRRMVQQGRMFEPCGVSAVGANLWTKGRPICSERA
jgi:hypothetical protein